MRTKIETLTNALASQPAIPDVTSVREEYARLAAEQATLQTDIAADRKQAATLKADLDAQQTKANVLTSVLTKQDRAERDAQYKQVDREHQHYELLSDLLGREGLQRHLMRQAETAIVNYANAILDSLEQN